MTYKNKLQNAGSIRKNNDGKIFNSIMRMIQKGVIDIISFNSLKGFIFKITIDNIDDVEFFNYNNRTKIYDIPVYSIVLKIAILSEKTYTLNDLIFPNPNTNKLYKHNKESDKINDFSNEANIQNRIYLKTIKGTGNPVCPSVIDNTILSSEVSQKFLDFLYKKKKDPKNKNTTNYVIAYLYYIFQSSADIDKIKRKFYLGIITMDLINIDYKPISYFNNSHDCFIDPNNVYYK